MDDAERLAVLLENREPRGAVGGVGRLVHASRFFRADDRADFGAETGRNRSVLDDPGDVWDSGGKYLLLNVPRSESSQAKASFCTIMR